jgi:hypothetical protein
MYQNYDYPTDSNLKIVNSAQQLKNHINLIIECLDDSDSEKYRAEQELYAFELFEFLKIAEAMQKDFMDKYNRAENSDDAHLFVAHSF